MRNILRVTVVVLAAVALAGCGKEKTKPIAKNKTSPTPQANGKQANGKQANGKQANGKQANGTQPKGTTNPDGTQPKGTTTPRNTTPPQPKGTTPKATTPKGTTPKGNAATEALRKELAGTFVTNITIDDNVVRPIVEAQLKNELKVEKVPADALTKGLAAFKKNLPQKFTLTVNADGTSVNVIQTIGGETEKTNGTWQVVNVSPDGKNVTLQIADTENPAREIKLALDADGNFTVDDPLAKKFGMQFSKFTRQK